MADHSVHLHLCGIGPVCSSCVRSFPRVVLVTSVTILGRPVQMDGRTDASSADQRTADGADGAARGRRASTQKAPGPGNNLCIVKREKAKTSSREAAKLDHIMMMIVRRP
jgi:hypothetical protein